MDIVTPKILFVIPGFFYIEEYQKLLYYNDIPLGTLQISSFLKQKGGIDTEIVDFRLETESFADSWSRAPNFDEFKELVIQTMEHCELPSYNVLGINCYTSYQYLQTELIGRIIREEFPKTKIVVGGYHPTAVPGDFIYKDSPFNFVIRGEAELALLDLLNSSLLKREKTQKISQDLEATECIDINSLPFPDYEMYLRRYPFKNKFKFDFYSSRGCPYQCAFCAKNYNFRSVQFEKFKADFNKLCSIIESYNTNPKIAFADQSFDRVLISEQILDYVNENNLHERFNFSCQCRVETMTEERLIRKYQNSKMVVGFGLESANYVLLREMHKTETPKEYVNRMQMILELYKNHNSSNTYCRLNVLCGFPGENTEIFNETVLFLKKYALHENIQISPTLFSNYPNVYVYNNMDYYEKKYGTEFIREWWKIPSNPFKNSLLLKPSRDYTRKDLIKDYKDEYIDILKRCKRNTFAELVIWKDFFNTWFKEL